MRRCGLMSRWRQVTLALTPSSLIRGRCDVAENRVAGRFSPDETWETAGAFSYTDEIADGMEARIKQFANMSGVPVSGMELAWLIEGYRRLRHEPEDS